MSNDSNPFRNNYSILFAPERLEKKKRGLDTDRPKGVVGWRFFDFFQLRIVSMYRNCYRNGPNID